MNRTPTLFPLDSITPSGGGSKPSPERSEYWIARMREAVDRAPDPVPLSPWVDSIAHHVCPECGLVVGRSCPVCTVAESTN